MPAGSARPLGFIAALALSQLACTAARTDAVRADPRSDESVSRPDEWSTPRFGKSQPGVGGAGWSASPGKNELTRGEKIALAAARLVGLNSLSGVTHAFP